MYSINTFESPYGCSRLGDNVFYNIHVNNVRCHDSNECYCKSPRPMDNGPDVYYITEGTCPMILSWDECVSEAEEQSTSAYEEKVYGTLYLSHSCVYRQLFVSKPYWHSNLGEAPAQS